MVNLPQEQSDSQNSDQEESSSLKMDDVSRMINAAISSRMKSFEKKFEEFATLLQPKQEAPKEEKISNSEMAQLKRQLEELRKERESEVQKRRDMELRTSVKESLLASGVKPEMVKAAMAVLVDSDKLVGYDEETNDLVFKSQYGNVDLKTGLKDWTKTDEGKSFLAPRSISGTGQKGFKQSKEQLNYTPSKEEVGSLLEEALLSGAFDKQ